MQVIFNIPRKYQDLERQAFLSKIKQLSLDIDVGIDAVIAKSEKAVEICNCYGLIEQKKRLTLSEILNANLHKFIDISYAPKTEKTAKDKFIIRFRKSETSANNCFFISDTINHTKLLYSVNKSILNIKD